MTREYLGAADGSSPLTRGKRTTIPGWVTDLGLIPAHAGKTSPRARRPARGRAHPRSRGENGKLDATKHTLTGSSPLTRGKLDDLVEGNFIYGLIPAHAGKT